MGLGHSPRIVTDGLVLCLDAANKRSYGGSGTTWTDLKGGNNGTLTNGASFDSSNLGSIATDGTNEYIDLGSTGLIATSSPFTINFSIRMNSMPSNITPPLVIKSSNSRNMIILISAVSGYQGVVIGSGGAVWAQGKTLTSSSFFLNNWVNICITYNGSGSTSLGNYKIYENLIDRSLTSGTPGLLSSTTNTIIGYINSYNTMDANISNFIVYNRALTADEIRQNYLATKERYA